MKTKQQIIEWVRDNLEAELAMAMISTDYTSDYTRNDTDRARAEGALDALEAFASDFEAFLKSHDFPERD